MENNSGADKERKVPHTFQTVSQMSITIDNSDYGRLFKQLSSSSPRVRQRAADAIYVLPKDQRLGVLADLIAYCDDVSSDLTLLWGLCFLPLSICWLCFRQNDLPGTNLLEWLVLITGLCVPTRHYHDSRGKARARAALQALIDETNDTRLIPMLLARVPQGQVMLAAESRRCPEHLARHFMRRQALKSLLPSLQAGEANTWSRAQKRYLALYLKWPQIDPSMTLSILRAIEGIEDADIADGLRVLQSKCRSKFTPSISAPLMGDRAQYIKTFAQIRLLTAEAAVAPKQVLLRGAGAPAATSETLLRPAKGEDPETPSAELLRPSREAQPE